MGLAFSNSIMLRSFAVFLWVKIASLCKTGISLLLHLFHAKHSETGQGTSSAISAVSLVSMVFRWPRIKSLGCFGYCFVNVWLQESGLSPQCL